MNHKKVIRIAVSVICLLLLAGILYYANYDRPRYTTTEDTGTEYETARVRKVIEDNTGVDTSNENIVRGSMKIQVEILKLRQIISALLIM